MSNTNYPRQLQQLGLNIARYRKLRGLTQEELAALISMSRTHLSNLEAPGKITSQETVSAYENGKHLPSLKSLIKMADIFHVSTDYLIGRSDVRKPSATSPLPNEDIALLDCFHDLDTVDKARLVAYAQGLADKSLKD